MARWARPFLGFLWGGFFLLAITGFYTADVYRAVFPISAVLLWLDARRGGDLFDKTVQFFRERVSFKVVLAVAAAAWATAIITGLLNLEALDGDLDLGQYLQATHSLVTRGIPEFSFDGKAIDYNFVHRSISKYILAGAYQLTGSSWVVPIWQEIFLLAPGWVCMLFYRAVCRRARVSAEPLGYLLCFLCWAWNPTVLLQTAWVYAFHIAAMTSLALAYLFYYERRWMLWSLALIATAFEKEEIGFIGFFFGLMVAGEAFFDRTLSRRRAVLAGALVTAGLTLVPYVTLGRKYPEMANFARSFGYLGATPAEAARALFARPGVYLKQLLRPEGLQYFLFFAVASFVWLKPRFSVAKYMIPVLPMIALNVLASQGFMAQLNMHYALPIMVGLCATLILGVFGDELQTHPARDPINGTRAFRILLVIILVPLLWGHEFRPRTLRKNLKLWRDHAQERKLVADLRSSPVICCEKRLCTSLLDRDNVFEINACTAGTSLLEPSIGKTARYLVYSETKLEENLRGNTPRVRVPDSWTLTTPLIKISPPVLVIR